MAYKSLAKKPKKSKAAKEADIRNKAHKQAKRGKLAQAVKTMSAASAKSRRMTKGEKRAIMITPFKPQVVPQPPKTPKMEKGLSLNALIKSTPRLMKENALECYVNAYKRGKTPKGLPLATANVRHKDPMRPNKTVRIHKPMIVGLDDPFKPISKQKRVMVSCSCLTGETKVLTDKGWKTIYELAADFNPTVHPINYIVNGQTYAGTTPYYTGKKKTYTLNFSNGSKVTATADHRFLVKPSRGEPVWKTVAEISPGDNLVLSDRQTPQLPKKTEKFYHMQYLGFLLGDGTLTSPENGYPDVRIYTEDKMAMIDRFTSLSIVNDVKESQRGSSRVSFNHKGIELVRKYHYNNVDAPKIRSAEQFYGFLSGLMCADASVSSKDNKILSVLLRGAESYIKTVYERLHRYGYSGVSMRLERKAGIETNKIGSSDVCAKSTKDLYCLTIPARDFHHLREYLELTDRFNSYEFKEFNEFRKPLTKVTDKFYSGKQHVYDITVPEVSQFVIGGSVISHNCENFVYMWEYADAEHGAARIIYGNGEPPNFTNPGSAPGLCKHLMALADLIKRNGD